MTGHTAKATNSLIAVASLLFFGTLGYMVIEGWGWFDSLYMTVTTLTTVGYSETHPLSQNGRVFTIVLILVGVGTLLFILSDLAATVIARTDVMGYFGRRRMQEQIDRLQGHHVVCGYGRTGQEVAYWLQKYRKQFVIVERDPDRCRQAVTAGYLALPGDATEDEVLARAGIQRATGIVCALADDAANTFITLAASGVNPGLHIVCRAANPGAESKMKRAGAEKVVSPYVIAGRRMAAAVTHPLVLEFVDLAMHDESTNLHMEQIVIAPESRLVGSSLKDANIKQMAGAMILAVIKGGNVTTNPPPELVFHENDIMIALGTDEQLEKLTKLAAAKA